MLLKLYGYIYSTNAQLVYILLKELNVPFKYIPVDLAKREHKKPEFLAKHPFGVVPVIDDDGFELYETRAILRYLLAKHGAGSTLIPTEPKAQALAERAISMEASYFESPALTVLIEKILAPIFGREPDEARYQEAVTKVESVLDIYDNILSKHKYLGGDELTLGDLTHVPLGKVVHMFAAEAFSRRPNVARWWADLATRPSVQALDEAIKKGTF